MPKQIIAVFNGTSRTLGHLTIQALAQGDAVRAVTRSAARYRRQFPDIIDDNNLSVHELPGYADLEALAAILEGVDVVYVALNAAGKGNPCSYFMSYTFSPLQQLRRLCIPSTLLWIPG